METNEVLLPGGYKLYDQEGFRMVGNRKEEFAVKNRSFLEVDRYFSQGISKTINELLNKRLGTQIRVLDLAGGTESQAVRDINEEIKYKDRVKAINIDFAQNLVKVVGVNKVQGDATHIPLADSCMDIVYSHQLLPFMKRFDREHGLQVKKVLSEVSRILKPGGVAFLDDEEELSNPKLEDNRQKLATELGVVFEAHNSANLKTEKASFPKFWDRKIRPAKFLVMKKS